MDLPLDTIRSRALVIPSYIFQLSCPLGHDVSTDDDIGKHEKVTYEEGAALFGKRDTALLLEPDAKVALIELSASKNIYSLQESFRICPCVSFEVTQG